MMNGKFLEKNKCDVPNKRDGRKLWKIRKRFEENSDFQENNHQITTEINP